MEYKLQFTDKARLELFNLPQSTKIRIAKKIDFFINSTNPMNFAKKLIGPSTAEYRFRIGDYRVLFDLSSHGNIIILTIITIQNRKNIYRDF